MLSFDSLTDLPPWIKTGVTLLLGAGAAKMLGVVLENRRLAKKEYRDTLLQRIRELENRVDGHAEVTAGLRVRIAQAEDDLEECRRLHAQRGGSPPQA